MDEKMIWKKENLFSFVLKDTKKKKKIDEKIYMVLMKSF